MSSLQYPCYVKDEVAQSKIRQTVVSYTTALWCACLSARMMQCCHGIGNLV